MRKSLTHKIFINIHNDFLRMNLWKKNFPVKRCLASFLLSESNSLAKSLTGASATYNKQAPFSITYRLKTLKTLLKPWPT